MKSNLIKRSAVALAVALVALYGVIGLPSSMEDVYAHIEEKINLGLDLRYRCRTPSVLKPTVR